MRGQQKAARVLQHQDGSGDQIALEGFSISDLHNSTIHDLTQGISAYLLPGEANALTLEVLETLTGLDRRMIRRRIQLERQAGACICVNNRDGYFLAENEAERARCVASMRRRAAEVYRTADAIERAEVVP